MFAFVMEKHKHWFDVKFNWKIDFIILSRLYNQDIFILMFVA